MQCAFLSRNFSLHHVQWTFLLLYQASVSLTMWNLFFVSQFEGVSKVYIKRFQNTCYFSLYVKLWGTAQRLVSHISPSRKLAKKKQRISDFFGMVSVWLFPSICLSSEIHIFKQKMCKCSIVRDTIWSSQLKWSSFLIFESAYTNR